MRKKTLSILDRHTHQFIPADKQNAFIEVKDKNSSRDILTQVSPSNIQITVKNSP